MLSEVFMIDDSPNVLVRVGVFPEVSEKVGHGWCRYACAPATVQFRLDGSQVITTDTKLRRSEFEGISLDVPGPDDTADEGEVPFNSCRPGGVANEYGVLVHEAGHALGIREANDGIEQIIHHPTIKDAVMGAIDDPGYACSPHPFDIMAIYALYQTVD